MSSLTPCNFCYLRAVKERVQAKGLVVTVRASQRDPFAEGFDVFVHYPSVVAPTEKDWVMWAMEIGDRCEC